MHNCTWWWGCGNEAFIHPDCHAQLKGRTCTNMIQQFKRTKENQSQRQNVIEDILLTILVLLWR
jgi:hypothetical protein